ncbi:hypothetical protein [Stenotrophomonas rhizophila]|uniref:hypothetical protein n=1 Tax=Stenotrophomonas rhizophila TaxID=216778 RepID=UPI001C92CC42|nr:hypothetical protein [Stenotrophomonas rhizophila]
MAIPSAKHACSSCFLAAPLSLVLCLLSANASAQKQDADAIAKKLSNPVAALISVPFQYNYDQT